MFTGIITDIGRVRQVKPGGDTAFTIATAYDTHDIAIGASIACAGVCLTVTEKGTGWFAVQASAETLSRTTLGGWREGTTINLERALRVGDELGGHVLAGQDDLRRGAARRPRQSRDRRLGPVCRADSGKGSRMSFVEVVSPIEDIIEDARNGRMFILVDDEGRENEGDIIIPAQMATPEAINFMAKHGRGLICLALTRQRVEQLALPLMPQLNASR